MKKKVYYKILKKVARFTALLFMLANVHLVKAQSPPSIPYQAIARNANGTPYVNANLTVRFSLHEQTATGTVSYAESKSLQTNDLGLFSTTFGSGTPITGTFSGINWAQTTKFLQVEINLGSTWVDMGTQQLMSVPYALYSGTAGALSSTNQAGNGNGCYSCPTEISAISSNTMNYYSAAQYCSNLNENGKTDWRVPTLDEFEYLRDVQNINVPNDNCWTKDFQISVPSITVLTVILTSRGIVSNLEFALFKTVCIR
jgi:hypothetical protein